MVCLYVDLAALFLGSAVHDDHWLAKLPSGSWLPSGLVHGRFHHVLHGVRLFSPRRLRACWVAKEVGSRSLRGVRVLLEGSRCEKVTEVNVCMAFPKGD